MIKIPLTQGKFARVDACDYDYLMQWKWCFSKGRGVGYAVRTDNANRKCVRMHRVILERMGHEDFELGSHINGDGLDNCRYNLRPVTQKQAAYSRRMRKNNTSGYIGVYFREDMGKGVWVASAHQDGKQVHLGYWNDPVDAARAYNEFVLEHRGEFAVLNEVD